VDGGSRSCISAGRHTQCSWLYMDSLEASHISPLMDTALLSIRIENSSSSRSSTGNGQPCLDLSTKKIQPCWRLLRNSDCG
jgi:hypothetical protein